MKAELKPQDLRIGNWVRLYVNDTDFTEFPIELPDFNLIHNSNSKREYEPIELSEEWLKRLGFEEKPAYEWKGNGYDYQPETSKTQYRDFVIDAEDEDYFFVRYATRSYRNSENDQWKSDTNLSVHKGSWYERAEEQIPCKPIKYIHDLQNLFAIMTGTELTLKETTQTV